MERRTDTAGGVRLTSMHEHTQGEFVRALLDPDLPPPRGLMASHGASPAGRIAVYRNNVIGGLVDALAQRFPVCLRLVGDAFFRATAQCYVRTTLPASPMLFEYGESFGEFLATFEPARELPYLPDVARLEYAVGRAYHAADATPLSLEELRSAPVDLLDDATVVFHPSTQLVCSRYPIVSIWRANMSDDDSITPIADHAQDALVTRRRSTVEAHALAAGGSTFVKTLMEGAALRDATEVAKHAAPSFDLSESLRILLLGEALIHLQIPKEFSSPKERGAA
jgi:hypothetical protein